MNSMGDAALLVAFFVCLCGAGLSLGGVLAKRSELIKSSEHAVYLSFGLLTVASVALMRAFLARDFSLLYVFEYSSRSLSDAYAAAAFWAGQEGSLLLWAWILSGFSVLALRFHRKRLPALMPWATFVLLINVSFFLLLLNFVSRPFAPFPGQIPADGYGLNPLLQDPGMVIHPPALFIGYAGLTVPYAFAMAALLAGRTDASWIREMRTWTVASWFVLGVGILLGAQWAYVELGWGGYWAWDPVENASLMPWLTAAAFMHSVMVQERRGMFKMWNMGLIIATYFLILFGTFITRSGLISSVHAFGKSSLGSFFLGFMILTLALGMAAVWWRRKLLTPEERLRSPVSGESAFLAGNVLFAVMAFSVFWGTVFPVLAELAGGVKVTVGPGFYNRVNVPFALILLLLIGVCPLLAWQRPSGRSHLRHLVLPFFLGVAGGAAGYASGIRNPASIIVMAFSGVVLGSVSGEFYGAVSARKKAEKRGFFRAGAAVIRNNRRRYGGSIAHLGMALVFIGLSGAPLSREVTGTITPGESLRLGDYTLKYLNMAWVPSKDRLAVATRLKVFHDGRPTGYLVPERRFYANREDQPTSEVSILSDWKEDLYVALTGYERDGRASFRVITNPLVTWLWLGGYVVGLGVGLALWPRRRPIQAEAVTGGGS